MVQLAVALTIRATRRRRQTDNFVQLADALTQNILHLAVARTQLRTTRRRAESSSTG